MAFCLPRLFRRSGAGREPEPRGSILTVRRMPLVLSPNTASHSYLLYLQRPAILIPLHHSSRWLCIHRTTDIAMDSHGHINYRGHVEDTGWVCERGGVEKHEKPRDHSKQKVSQCTLPVPLQKNLYICYFRFSTFSTGLGARATSNPTLQHLQPRGHTQQAGAGCTLLSPAQLAMLLRTLGRARMHGGTQRHISNGPGLQNSEMALTADITPALPSQQ